MRKSKSAFTILEVMTAVVIISILASMSIVGYQGYRDRAAILMDETNQQVLVAATKLYAYDNNALPGSMSQLRPQDLERAYALVSAGRSQYTVLAYLREVMGGEVAEAVPLPSRYYQSNPSIVRCPSDTTEEGVSYQINSRLANRPLSELLGVPPNTILIFESDTEGDTGGDPGQPIFRHGRGQIAVRATVGGAVERFRSDPETGADQLPSGGPNP